MSDTISETTLTIIITTSILIGLGALVIYFLFLYQRKRYSHQKDLIELRESFNRILLQSKLEIQEQTLDHIAKELHANFSHLVSVININLSTLSPQKPDEMKEKIAETKSLAKQLMAELKALSVNLNTDHIMKIGFTKSLENELNRLDKTKQYKVSFAKKGYSHKLSPENEIILFRMCQEILNNIVKHAEAKSISVSLDYSGEILKLEILDDGKGFDVFEAKQKSHDKESTGIYNIYSRSKLINADLKIESTLGEGTLIIVTIPNNQAK